MKSRKRFIFILLFAFVLAMFNGCGGKEKENIIEPWKKANKLDPVTLTLYLPASLGWYSAYYGNQLVNEITEKLNERLKVINAKLEIGNVVFEDAPLRMTIDKSYKVAIESGLKVDLFFKGSSYDQTAGFSALYNLPLVIKELGDNNHAADLTELFKNYAPQYYSKFEKEELDLLTYKGKLLAIPSLNYPNVSRTVAVVREDLVQKYKIKPIKSLEEYENFLETIRKNESDIIPVLFGAGTLNYNYILFDYFGRNYGYFECGSKGSNIVCRMDDPDMKLVAWERTKEFLDIARMIRDWYQKGYLKEIRQVDMLDVLSGQYASFIGKTGTAEQYNQILNDNGGRPWKYVEYELFPESIIEREFNPFPLICINPNSENKERAVMLIELLMSDQESYDIFTYGIEKKDFVYDKNNKPKAIVPSGYIPEVDSYMVNHAKWSFRNIFMEHEPEKAVREKQKSLKKNTVLNPLAGFIVDSNAYSGSVPADTMSQYRSSSEKRIINGQMSDSEIQEYIDNIKPVLDPRLNELQRQVDAWKAENGIS